MKNSDEDSPLTLLLFAILMLCFALSVTYMSDSINDDGIDLNEKKTDTMLDKWRRIF